MKVILTEASLLSAFIVINCVIYSSAASLRNEKRNLNNQTTSAFDSENDSKFSQKLSSNLTIHKFVLLPSTQPNRTSVLRHSDNARALKQSNSRLKRIFSSREYKSWKNLLLALIDVKLFLDKLSSQSSIRSESNWPNENSTLSTSIRSVANLLNENSTANDSIDMHHADQNSSATSRQFHLGIPPYNHQFQEDLPPHEKISFHDVLPIKVVKFVKSMVEDAPWEDMFMKMVRMVVDNFVDAIIEKMFAAKDDKDKFRSINSVSNTLKSLLELRMPVTRMKRASGPKKSSSSENELGSSFEAANKIFKNDKDKEVEEEPSWFDMVLDYLFPDDPKLDDDDSSEEKRKRRETESKKANMRRIMNIFMEKYRALSSVVSDLNHGNESGNMLTDKSSNKTTTSSKFLLDLARTSRQKRSVKHHKQDLNELWQDRVKERSSRHKLENDCSLRKACSAGKLLSRLPSIHDISLQLKQYGSEPLWDAFLFGMHHRKCNKIVCKRHRTPKGAHHQWNLPLMNHHYRD